MLNKVETALFKDLKKQIELLNKTNAVLDKTIQTLIKKMS
jgi:hypothetical protein